MNYVFYVSLFLCSISQSRARHFLAGNKTLIGDGIWCWENLVLQDLHDTRTRNRRQKN